MSGEDRLDGRQPLEGGFVSCTLYPSSMAAEALAVMLMSMFICIMDTIMGKGTLSTGLVPTRCAVNQCLLSAHTLWLARERVIG